MNGQWIGQYIGANNGFAMINIDDMGNHYEGVAYLISYGLPTIYAEFHTPDKNKSFRFKKLPMFLINPKTAEIDSWDNIKEYYPHVNNTISSYVDVEGNLNQETLKLTWITENGFESGCELPKSSTNKESEYIPIEVDWDGYKNYLKEINLEPRKFIFRGQNEIWRLQTTFHRTGRANLKRFLNDDRMELHRHLSARTRHVFDIKNPDENGAFLNLVQHHGYPTPLLDWTYSPYVAAFFAYRKVSSTNTSATTKSDKVRIFIFDIEKWQRTVPQSVLINPPFPNIAIMRFIAIDNDRMLPQQAVSTMTNIDDIESFIRIMEKEKNTEYLSVIDLYKEERKKVMVDLSYMGITASSLFPGLDGACEALRERFFEI